MAQELFEKNLTTEFVALEDLMTIDPDVTYQIQNRGPDYLLAVEPDAEPTTEAGTLLKPYSDKLPLYKKGQNTLYLRALHSNCSFNVTSLEPEE